MALFAINRYMGEDEDPNDSQADRASSILQKLQDEAKVRKLQRLSADSVSLESKEVANKSEKKKGKRKHSTEVGSVGIESKGNEAVGILLESPKTSPKSPNKTEHEGLANTSTDIEQLHGHEIYDRTLLNNNFQGENVDSQIDVDSELEASPKKKSKKEKIEVKIEESPRKKSKKESVEDEIKNMLEKRTEKTNEDTDEEKTNVLVSSPKKDKKQKKKKSRKVEERTDTVTDEDNNSVRESNISSPQRKKKKKVKENTSNKSETVNDSVSERNEDVATRSDSEEGNEEQGEGLQEETMDTEEMNDEDMQEVGGFTVLGDIKPKKTQKVHRVLPDWLSNPNVISADLRNKTLPFCDVEGLDPELTTKLRENGITNFFPVQRQVIPQLLEDTKYGYHVGRGGLRPSDICVSAPTGSGKTLAFVLPIVQALKNRVVCQVRALAVLPVRDLATQVFKVFQTYCKGTSLKVGLLVGQKPFEQEQHSLVRRRFRGYQSLVDILVATPGRLVDHINKTEGFHLSSLRFLVIDEADRMMEEIKQDWLSQVEGAVYRGSHSGMSGRQGREVPGPLTVASLSKMQMPLQKMLFSATLSQNPEKLQQLNLFQPKLFTSVVTATRPVKTPEETTLEMSSPGAGEFVGKYTTPAGLTEYIVESSLAEKPLMVLHFLHNLKFRHVLCFTNSVEATHRLYWLVKLMGNIEVREFSSGQHGLKRDKILKQFEAGKIDIIICSDAMARGMDVENVKYVISYDPPPFIKTYIHRIGRTARAGKTGIAITLLQKKEFYHFKKMVKDAGKSNLQTMKVNKESLKPMVPSYQNALKEMPQVLKGERSKKKSSR